MPPNLKRKSAFPSPPKRPLPSPVVKQQKHYHTIDTFSDIIIKYFRPNEFVHTPLSPVPQSDEIRLLVLDPGERTEMIRCSFVVVSLSALKENHEYQYEALSYYWGTDQPSHEIRIRQSNMKLENRRTLKNVSDLVKPQKFYIRSNLRAALEQFRDRERNIYLWVDALCIDQEDEREKNQQVLLMADIYSQANRVCIWLGAGNPKCEQAMDFIEEVVDLPSLDTLTTDDATVNKWDALANLMRCRWFSRRWVIQELVLARDATLHYGEKGVHWTDFADAVALFVTRFDDIKSLFRLSRQFNHNPEHMGNIVALGANNLVNVASNLFRRASHGQGDKIERLSSLEALVSSLLSFEASDPRDTVYALLSIAKDYVSSWDASSSLPNTQIIPLAPDYQKSMIEVYRDFTKFCIETSRSVDIICRHWAPFGRKASATTDPVRLPNKKSKRKEDYNVKIPSWVPSLDRSPFGNPESALNGRVHGDSLVGHPDRKNYKADGGGLPATFRFEEITSSMTSGDESPPIPDVSITKNAVFFLHVKGFQIDVVQKVSSRIAGGLLLRESLVMGGWEDPEDQLEEVPNALWRTLVADRSPEGDNPPSWYHRACLNCFAHSTSTGDIDTGALIANPRSSSIMTKFLRRVQSVVWNRQFLKSVNHDFFGLAPMGTQVGDIICILLGCSVPVILREHRTPASDLFPAGEFEYFELIGEAYVYGLMDGEALHQFRSLTTEMEHFKLG